MLDKRRWLPRWQRVELVQKCLGEGMTRRQAAAWRRVSVSTVQYWIERYRSASDQDRSSGTWAEDRPSTPYRQPARCSEQVHDRVCEARQRTGWGPRLIASELQMATRPSRAALPARTLTSIEEPARGCTRLSGPVPAICLRWTSSALHASRPGTVSPAIAIAQARKSAPGRMGVRPLDDRRPPPTGLHRVVRRRAGGHGHRLSRALAFFAGHGITAKRLQTDNHSPMQRTAPARAAGREHIRHRFIPRARPSATARWSDISRRSRASGPTDSAIAQARLERRRCRSGSCTTTPLGTTAASATGHLSAVFGRS